MRARAHVGQVGFTLIELLVVVAIIALLISILLPSLSAAREQAKAAKCGAQLRALGIGLHTYATENRDWLPGRNTTGMNFAAALRTQGSRSQIEVLRQGRNPVQNYDWISPILKYETELGLTRFERWQTVINFYACPSNVGLRVDFLFDLDQAADKRDYKKLGDKMMRPLSYLMPVWFQLFGEDAEGTGIGSGAEFVPYRIRNAGWEADLGGYRPMLTRLGNAARKIAATDATRYLTRALVLDFDVKPEASTFGSFTSSGGWWQGATSLGVEQGSENWDGQTVTRGSESGGANLALSYRHVGNKAAAPTTAQTNQGSLNALHFDGHVKRMGDRASRNVEWWYPKGTIIRDAKEGMTRVPKNFEVP